MLAPRRAHRLSPLAAALSTGELSSSRLPPPRPNDGGGRADAWAGDSAACGSPRQPNSRPATRRGSSLFPPWWTASRRSLRRRTRRRSRARHRPVSTVAVIADRPGVVRRLRRQRRFVRRRRRELSFRLFHCRHQHERLASSAPVLPIACCSSLTWAHSRDRCALTAWLNAADWLCARRRGARSCRLWRRCAASGGPDARAARAAVADDADGAGLAHGGGVARRSAGRSTAHMYYFAAAGAGWLLLRRRSRWSPPPASSRCITSPSISYCPPRSIPAAATWRGCDPRRRRRHRDGGADRVGRTDPPRLPRAEAALDAAAQAQLRTLRRHRARPRTRARGRPPQRRGAAARAIGIGSPSNRAWTTCIGANSPASPRAISRAHRRSD